MRPIPDYFLALVKQYGNLVSNDEAVRVTKAITAALDGTLEPARSRYLFTILPSYLKPSQQKFFVRLTTWQNGYKHATIIEHLSLRLQLTDRIEAVNILNAYFKAVKTVIEPGDKIKLARVLPAELNQIYIKA